MIPSTYPPHARNSAPTEAIKMYVRDAGQLTLPVADLIYLQATGNYTWLYWKDRQRMLMPRTLKYYVPQLPENLFVRLHRNCIVNLNYIERMEREDPDKGGLVYLRSGAVLPVSRRRWYAAKKLFQQRKYTN